MHQFKKRIRSDQRRTYLWGTETIRDKFKFRGGLVLNIQVEETGEKIELFSVKDKPFRDDDDELKVGELEPGDIHSLLLDGAIAVFAKCSTAGTDSAVICSLMAVYK